MAASDVIRTATSSNKLNTSASAQAAEPIAASSPFTCMLRGLKDALNFASPWGCLWGSYKEHTARQKGSPAAVPAVAAPGPRARRPRGDDNTRPNVYEAARRTFLLNGVIFLGSQIAYTSVLRPVLFSLLHAVTAFGQGQTYEQGMIEWIDFVLSVIYNFGWVFPVFIITKVINAWWYQDIADGAYSFFRGERQRSFRDDSYDRVLIASLADTIYTVVLELVLIIQCAVVNMVPTYGPVLNFVLSSWLCSLYCFEYTWVNAGWDIGRRIAYFETHWAYFLGFGIPFTIITSYASFLLSAALFALFFPWFILSATAATPIRSAAFLLGVVPERFPIAQLARWATGGIMNVIAQVMRVFSRRKHS